jgi:hypothetical protein
MLEAAGAVANVYREERGKRRSVRGERRYAMRGTNPLRRELRDATRNGVAGGKGESRGAHDRPRELSRTQHRGEADEGEEESWGRTREG